MFEPTGYWRIGQAAKRLLDDYLSGDVAAHTHHLNFATTNIDEEDARAEIGKALASKRLRSAGILPGNGELVAIPDAYWRTDQCRAVIFNDQPTEYVTIRGSQWSGFFPLVAETDIQDCFGCVGRFQTPTVWPAEWGKDSPFLAILDDHSFAAGSNARASVPSAAPLQIKADRLAAAAIPMTPCSDIVMPQEDVMDAAETLSWIAFRKALPLSRWRDNIYGISHDWPFGIGCLYSTRCLGDAVLEIGGPRLLLRILQVKAEERHWREGALGMLVLRAEEVDAQFQTFLRARNVGAAQLLADLKNDLKNAEVINVQLRRANTELRRALEAGRLRAAGGPADEFGTLVYGRTYIAAADWKIGTEILPTGRMVERDGNKQNDKLLFDTDEVLSLWSGQVAQVAEPASELLASAVDQPAAEGMEVDQTVRAGIWMDGYANGFVATGKKIKREDSIKACMAVLGCSYIIAEGEYEALPWPGLRNKPRTPVA